MTLKNIYSIPKFKKLDKVGKIIFVFSFLFPALILYTFFHLYFLPFGLNKDYTLESKELRFTSKENFYTTEDNKELLDGIAIIEVNPRISKRNVITTISIEGENNYILKPILDQTDVLNMWDFEKSFEDETEYVLLNEYETRNEDFITFKLELELDDWEGWTQLILKHENLRILRNENSIILRVDEIINHEHKIFTSEYFFDLEDEDELEKPLTIYANYKKTNDSNGFIDLYVNKYFAGRTVIEKKQTEFENIETVWNEEFLKDISQKYISLKQEEYVAKLGEAIPEELIGTVNFNLYYEKLFKPEMEVEEDEGDDDDDNEDEFDLIKNNNFEYDDLNRRIQKYYPKEFYQDFLGEIKKISVGYQYPFGTQQEYSTLFSLTPFKIVIAGENSEIKNFTVNLQRTPTWKKLKDF